MTNALLETFRNGRIFAMEAPMSERVRLWREDYGHFESDPDSLIERLRHLEEADDVGAIIALTCPE